jgi:hypothetical protein
MKLWDKWVSAVNDGSPIKLFYYSLLFILLTVGVNSYGDEVVPWIQNIFVNPYQGVSADRQFLLTSFLGPLIAYLLQVRDETGFLLLTLAGFVVGNILVFRQLKSLDKERYFVHAFLLYSLSASLVVWFGKSDMWFFVLSTLLVVLRHNYRWSLVIALLLGLTHLEQALVVVGMLGLMLLNDALQNKSFKSALVHYLPIVSGALLAKLALVLFFTFNGFGSIEGRLDYIVNRGYEAFVEPVFKNAIVYFFSMMDMFWLLFFGLAAAFLQQGGKRWVLWIAFVMAVAVASLTFDATRVFSIVFWPMIVYLLLVVPNEKLIDLFDRRLMPMLLAAALLFPVVQMKMSGALLFAGSVTYTLPR